LVATEDQGTFISKLQKKLKLKKLFFISAQTGGGLPELMKEVWRVLKEEETKQAIHSENSGVKQPSHKIFRPHLDNPKNFEIQYLKKFNKKKYYKVTGKRIEQLAKMTDMSQPQAIIRMGHYLKKFGIIQALYKEGATAQDTIIIAEKEFPCTQTISWKKVK
jgi:Obg family GTPase CgtA-like protein